MTPDVSRVLAAVEELSEPIADFAFRMDAFKRDTALTPPSPEAIVEVMDQIQQAAEQACYRYCLDRMMLVFLRGEVADEIARLKQLIAESA